MGISPDQFRQMEERVERNRGKKPVPALPVPSVDYLDAMTPLSGAPPVTPIPPSLAPDESCDLVFACVDRYRTHEFVLKGKPIGKPRMTQRDKFIKRPNVQRYWAFKDALRAAAGTLPLNPDMVIVTAWVPVPPSWPKKKREAKVGQPCREKPDWDNIGKAVCDALFDEDACIWVGVTIKYWCLEGQERLNVKVLYAKS